MTARYHAELASKGEWGRQCCRPIQLAVLLVVLFSEAVVSSLNISADGSSSLGCTTCFQKEYSAQAGSIQKRQHAELPYHSNARLEKPRLFQYSHDLSVQHCQISGNASWGNKSDVGLLHLMLRYRQFTRTTAEVRGVAFFEHLHAYRFNTSPPQQPQLDIAAEWQPQLFLRSLTSLVNYKLSFVPFELRTPSWFGSVLALAPADQGPVEFQLRVLGWPHFCTFVPQPMGANGSWLPGYRPNTSDLYSGYGAIQGTPAVAQPKHTNGSVADSIKPLGDSLQLPWRGFTALWRRMVDAWSAWRTAKMAPTSTHSTAMVEPAAAAVTTAAQALHTTQLDSKEQRTGLSALQQPGSQVQPPLPNASTPDLPAVPNRLAAKTLPRSAGTTMRALAGAVSKATVLRTVHLQAAKHTHARSGMKAAPKPVLKRHQGQGLTKTIKRSKGLALPPMYVLIGPFYFMPGQDFVTLLLQHMRYHVAYGVTKYIVYVVQHMQEVLADPRACHLVATGRLQLVLWTEFPLHEEVPYQMQRPDMYAHQSLIYNHQMLALWGDDEALVAVLDLDEYLMTPRPHMTLADVFHECGGKDVGSLTVPRFKGMCKGCGDTQRAMWLNATSGPHPILRYVLTDAFEPRGKVIVKPSEVKAFRVHEAITYLRSRAVLGDSRCAVFVHLTDMVKPRTRWSDRRTWKALHKPGSKARRWLWAATSAASMVEAAAMAAQGAVANAAGATKTGLLAGVLQRTEAEQVAGGRQHRPGSGVGAVKAAATAAAAAASRQQVAGQPHKVQG